MLASDSVIGEGADADGIFRGEALVAHLSRRHISEILGATAAADPSIRQHYWSDGTIVSLSFGELAAQGLHLARALRALGIAPGDCVAIQMPNRAETAVAYRACFEVGACLVPVTHIYGASELSYILSATRAKLLIIPDRWRSIDFTERLPGLGACPSLEHVIVIGREVENCLSWQRLMESEHASFEPPMRLADQPALLLFTSGTTAAPKGVVHTSVTLLSEIDQRAQAGDHPAEPSFSAWPAGHIGGFMSLIGPQLVGGESVIMDRWVPEEGTRLISDYKVTRSAGVPVFLAELLDAATTLAIDLSSLGGYMTGAANVPPELVERAERQGISVYRCYGSTEHPTVTSGRPGEALFDRARTDGMVLPGNEVRLLDDDGRDVAGFAEGEIVTRGHERFVGYLDASLDDEAFIDGGWFRTGDIGRFEKGRLIITDRKKDIVIRGGENISSKEVEDLLATHPSVAEVAAFAVPHARLGEGVCVAVRLVPGHSIDLADISAHFRGSGVAPQKIPERLEVVETFPRTPSGKIRKVDLRKQYAQVIGEKNVE